MFCHDIPRGITAEVQQAYIFNLIVDKQRMLALMVPGYKNVSYIVAFFQNLHEETREQFPGIMQLLQLLLVVPATSATAERSFSMLRRIKTYLRSTMHQERLNHLCITNAYQDKVDIVNMNAIMKESIDKCEYRRDVFG